MSDSVYVPELSLISALLSKENYKNYYQLVDLKSLKENNRELWHVYQALEYVHENVDSDLSLSDLVAWFWAKYPSAEHAVYDDLFKRLNKNTLGELSAVSLLKDIQRKQAALALSEISYRISNGSAQYSDAQPFLDILNGSVTVSADELTPLNIDLEGLLQDVYQRPGLRWRLNCLNKSLGSLRAGDFGFIFARPETGKTTFLASEVSNFLTQTEGTICHFNNEEDGKKVILRYYQAFFGCRLEQLIANVRKFKVEFEEATSGRFRFYDSATLSRTQIERIIARDNPRLVIYDQIDKIKGFAADREDLRLGSIYQWGRELAKNSHSVIGVCQADGSAENQKFLNMDNVANAKTSKQAEGDWILGIGKIHDMGQENVRFLNICKNKLMADEDSDPKLRHGKFEVLIDAPISRYKDIINYDSKRSN
jgi:replicative DNA helicase